MSTLSQMQKQIESLRRKHALYLHLFPSKKHFYCQVIDPLSGRVILASSTVERGRDFVNGVYGNTVLEASSLANQFSSRAVESGFTHLKIWKTDKNRQGFYHGRVKAFLDGVRQNGIIVD